MFALFVDVIVVLLLIIGVAVILSQVIVPTIWGGVLFPAFRRRVRVAKHNLTELTTEGHILALEDEVERLRARIIKSEDKSGDVSDQHEAPEYHPDDIRGSGGVPAPNIVIDTVTLMKP